jgi:NDP-sugar pyrophosphorylase family protein
VTNAHGGLSLVMPMAGRGSRFTRDGRLVPKPLIPLFGKPLFVWAVESLRRAVPVGEMIFVILSEHIRDHALDKVIAQRYPAARLIVLDDVTAGEAQTAAIAIGELKSQGPFAVNDCDHAFQPRDLSVLNAGMQEGAAGALMGYPSSRPDDSYVRLNAAGDVIQTAEASMIGPYAIAGCYLFGWPDEFMARFEAYRRNCPHPELFISGMYDAMARAGAKVLFQPLERYVPFGSPEDLGKVEPADLAFLADESGG